LVSSFSGYFVDFLPSGISANPTERTVSLVLSFRELEGINTVLMKHGNHGANCRAVNV
jgi:hypothetical protein